MFFRKEGTRNPQSEEERIPLPPPPPKPPKLCVHEWTLLDMYVQPQPIFQDTNKVGLIIHKEIYVVGCPKCNVQKVINKEDYERFVEVFPVVKDRCNVIGHEDVEKEISTISDGINEITYYQKKCQKCGRETTEER